jgi:hypothetical protein
MLQLFLFFAVLLFMGAADIWSMLKSELRKELVPYCILMLAAGAAGLFYLSNPYRQSIAYWIFNLLNING